MISDWSFSLSSWSCSCRWRRCFCFSYRWCVVVLYKPSIQMLSQRRWNLLQALNSQPLQLQPTGLHHQSGFQGPANRSSLSGWVSRLCLNSSVQWQMFGTQVALAAMIFGLEMTQLLRSVNLPQSRMHAASWKKSFKAKPSPSWMSILSWNDVWHEAGFPSNPSQQRQTLWVHILCVVKN